MWRDYYSPASVYETLRLRAEYGQQARIIAGGTDLLVELRRGARHDLALIDGHNISGWHPDDLIFRGLAYISEDRVAADAWSGY